MTSKVATKDHDKPHAHQFPGQHSGEVVEIVFHQHPVVMRKTFVAGLVILLVAILPLFGWSVTSLAVSQPGLFNWAVDIFGLGALVVVAMWIYRWIGWYYSVYIVTNERIVEIKQRGFFNRRVNEFGLDKIQNVNYHISGLQAVIFQFGDITVQTYVGDLIMSHIHKPVAIHEDIVEIVRQFNSSTQSRS